MGMRTLAITMFDYVYDPQGDRSLGLYNSVLVANEEVAMSRRMLETLELPRWLCLLTELSYEVRFENVTGKSTKRRV